MSLERSCFAWPLEIRYSALPNAGRANYWWLNPLMIIWFFLVSEHNAVWSASLPGLAPFNKSRGSVGKIDLGSREQVELYKVNRTAENTELRRTWLGFHLWHFLSTLLLGLQKRRKSRLYKPVVLANWKATDTLQTRCKPKSSSAV